MNFFFAIIENKCNFASQLVHRNIRSYCKIIFCSCANNASSVQSPSKNKQSNDIVTLPSSPTKQSPQKQPVPTATAATTTPASPAKDGKKTDKKNKQKGEKKGCGCSIS